MPTTPKDTQKWLQSEIERLSANVRSKRKRFTDDDSRKLIDLVQAMGKVRRIALTLDDAWSRDVLKFVEDYFKEVRKEKV